MKAVSSLLVNRSNFCLRNLEGLRFIPMRYFERAVLRKHTATSGKQIFVDKVPSICACLFRSTRCGPHRERTELSYSSLFTSPS